ncbi:YkvA family protein [Sphingosinicella sp. CPCC 101087]|uniref:YkvA family protein n=1 Tax=Sphingosinicella sp. CPCC 101087 TaxID=2497754 RepID=UPI00101B6361|nr:YkvA family protein [Sphingosinicella sp. CPCC 101087]
MRKPRRNRQSLTQKLLIEAHAVWLAARDPRTPWHARAFGLLIAAYALSPIDLIPDFIPVLGLVDDAILIPAGIWLFVKMLPPGQFEEHRAAASTAAERPRKRAGILIVLAIWIGLALLAWSLIRWSYD